MFNCGFYQLDMISSCWKTMEKLLELNIVSVKARKLNYFPHF